MHRLTAPRKHIMSEWIECFGWKPDLPEETLVETQVKEGYFSYLQPLPVKWLDSAWEFIAFYRLAVERQEPGKDWTPCETPPREPGVYERKGAEVKDDFFQYWTGARWGGSANSKEHAYHFADFKNTRHIFGHWRAVREGKQVTINAAQAVGGGIKKATASQEAPGHERLPAAAPNKGFNLSWVFPNLRGLVTDPALIKRLQEIAQEVQRGAAAPAATGQGDGEPTHANSQQSAPHPLRRDVYGLKIKWPELREVTRHKSIEVRSLTVRAISMLLGSAAK